MSVKELLEESQRVIEEAGDLIDDVEDMLSRCQCGHRLQSHAMAAFNNVCLLCKCYEWRRP